MTKTSADLQVALDKARAALDSAAPIDSGDPAVARLAAPALRQHHRRTDAQLARYTALRGAVETLEHKLALATAREREAARARLTVDDVRGAWAVKTSTGWHKVVRVNARSVTVETGYSWTDRIALDKVLEVRA